MVSIVSRGSCAIAAAAKIIAVKSATPLKTLRVVMNHNTADGKRSSTLQSAAMRTGTIDSAAGDADLRGFIIYNPSTDAPRPGEIVTAC